MDALCLKAGIHVTAAPIAASAEKPSVSSAPARNLPWGFNFRYPLRSLWPRNKTRLEPAIAVNDAVLVEEKDEIESKVEEGNWVFKILHVRSLWKEDSRNFGEEIGVKLEENEKLGEEKERCGEVNGECDMCAVNDDDDEKMEFDKESFSKLLRKVPLAEARLYARMSYLGSLTYSISQIKPGNLLRNHGFRFLTSSLEKKELALKLEKEKASVEEEEQNEAKESEVSESENVTENINGNLANSASAYEIAASAASYLQSHTKSFIRFKSSESNSSEDSNRDRDIQSLMATTDSVTSVVAAKEEVKQAVADDLNSTRSSPCEWFVCDDDQMATRFFVIQGSESLASWQANLLFEPVQFEGLDVLVHRGIYEAAKGIYEQMLPEIRSHLKSHGEHATLRFTGHSLGGSLSLLINLMLLIRGEAPCSSLLPVITFGAPSIMCGGDRLLCTLGLPRNHVRSITMHRDIVPRAFSCNYPNHVTEFLKAVNGNFRNHPCLNRQKLLYSPMGEFIILQPDDKFSPNHDLLPSGSGLYLLTCPLSDISIAEKKIRSAQSVFLNSPHPLEILSDRSAYGNEGSIQRDHDMSSYLKSVRTVIRQERKHMRKGKRESRRKSWWPLVAADGGSGGGGVIFSRPVVGSGNVMGRAQFNVSGIVKTGSETLVRFSRLVASQHMHLLVVLLFPAKLLVVGTNGWINLY